MQLLETDLLLLRPFTLDDAGGAVRLRQPPEVGPPGRGGAPPERGGERQVIENIFVPSDALAVLPASPTAA